MYYSRVINASNSLEAAKCRAKRASDFLITFSGIDWYTIEKKKEKEGVTDFLPI